MPAAEPAGYPNETRLRGLLVLGSWFLVLAGNPMTTMVNSVPLPWVLIVAAALFCIGLFGALSRRNTIGILLGVELMLNAVNINLVAFWRYLEPALVAGQVFALFIIVVAAAEGAVGLAMVIAVYRARTTVNADEMDMLKG